MNESVDLGRWTEWFTAMADRLEEMDKTQQNPWDFYDQIQHAREGVSNIQAVIPSDFADQKNEMLFYRDIWPKFYGKLFYYLLLHNFAQRREALLPGGLAGLIGQEEARISRFFLRHNKPWMGHKVTTTISNRWFTREYSAGSFFEPMSLLFEVAGTTIASYRVAWGLAYEEYRAWLRRLPLDEETAGRPRFEWKETKSAAAEFIKAQVEAGSIYINGKPATAVQLRTDFERRFGVELKDFENLLYAMDTLKIEETPYLTKLRNAFLGWKRRLGK